VTLFVLISFFFILINLFIGKTKFNLKMIFYKYCPALLFFLGFLPFFITNYFFSGNPFFSLHFRYMPELTGITDRIIVNATNSLEVTSTGVLSSGFSFQQLISFILKYYSPNITTLYSDLKGILFFSDNGSMPIVALTPLLVLGLFSLLIIITHKRKISEIDLKLSIYALFLILGILLAYLRALHSLQISEGIAPDIRYLSSIYLPAGIIGLLTMKYWKYNLIDNNIWKKSILILFIGVPIALILLLILQPFGGGFFYFNYTISLCSFCLLIILLIQFIIMEFFNKWYSTLITSNLLLLMILSLTWQILVVFLFALARFDGYTYWLPMSEVFINSFIVPVS
jgi:hypothetical protein